MDVPKISVIVPVYNSEKHLERCINSILSQTFKDFECLLIDDCSMDNSLEICNSFKNKDNRIKIYHKQNNEGTAQARKTGVFYAVAKYIIFTDNDDWIEPIMFEELYTEANLENYDIVCCDFFDEYPTKTIYTKQEIRNKTSIELIKEIIAWDNFLPVTWNKLVKAEIYKKVDFPKIIYSEDRVIMTQVFHFCNKIGYVNKGLYHWCHIETSASRANIRKIRNIIEDYISYTAILLFIIDNEIDIVKMTNEILNHIGNMGFLCLGNKKILNVYRNSIEKILELKLGNKLTKELLFSEQNTVEKKIIKLDSQKKAISRISKLLTRLLKRIIPKKLKKWLKHGHGT